MQKAAVLVLNLTWGVRLLSALFGQRLTAGICQPSIPPSTPTPNMHTQPPSVTSVWKARREGGGERSQALGCQLTRDGGQGLPEDTGSYAETAQGRVAAPTPRTLRMKGAGVHRCLICSTSLRLCRILVGGLHWFVIAAGGLSLVAVSRGHSLVAFCVLLIAITSLVAEHELQSVQASVVVTCRLSCCGT